MSLKVCFSPLVYFVFSGSGGGSRAPPVPATPPIPVPAISGSVFCILMGYESINHNYYLYV